MLPSSTVRPRTAFNLKTWRKDKKTRAKFDAAWLIVKAEAYVDAGDDKKAAGVLKKITKQRNYKDTPNARSRRKTVRRNDEAIEASVRKRGVVARAGS